MRRLIPLLGAVAIIGSSSTARQLPSQVVELRPLAPGLPGSFTQISSVRELRDGRVLIADDVESRLFVVSAASGVVEQVGREGRGPGEYAGVTQLHALGGDSSVMVDKMRRWLMLVGARIVDVFADTKVVQQVSIHLHGVDTLGRALTLRGPPGLWERSVSDRDSLNLEIIHRVSGSAALVGRVRVRTGERKTLSRPNGRMLVFMQYAPFATGEQTVLFPDGWIAIARLDPYRVDWRSPTGEFVKGPPLPFVPQVLTEEDRNRFIAENPPRQGYPSAFDFSRFPAHFPAFHVRGLVAMPDGRLAVKRVASTSARRNCYDLVDRAGKLSAQICVGEKERILGFGATTIYVAKPTEDGFEQVIRYAWR